MENQAAMMAVAQNPAAQQALQQWMASSGANTQQMIQPQSQDHIQKKGRAITFKELGHDFLGMSTLGMVGRRPGQSWGEAIKDDSGWDQTQRAFGGSRMTTSKPMQMQNNAPQLYWGNMLNQPIQQ